MRRAARHRRRLTALVPGLVLGAAVLGCSEPPAPLDLPTGVRGHPEVSPSSEGAEPWFLGADAVAGLCVQVPPDRDTSQWRARLSLDGELLDTAPREPAARAGRTLCFDAPISSGAPEGRGLPLCGHLVDGFDGAEFALPCRPVRRSADDRGLAAARAELSSLLTASNRRPLPALLADLDALADRARSRELSSFAVRVELIAVHFLALEGTPEALTSAGDRLARLPAWVDRPAAGRRGAQAAYERAERALAQGRRAAAWSALETADRRYLRVADGERISVALLRSDLLAGAGAIREGRERLDRALADCAQESCSGALVAAGRRQRAWLTLLDPLAREGELDAAADDLEAGAAGLTVESDPLELANQRLNAAYLAVRRSGDPGAPLAEARRALGASERGSARRGFLLGWAELIEGLAALERGDGAAAVARCEPLASSGDGELATWGASCLGSAHRLAGDRERAARVFDETLLRHEERGDDPFGRRLPLGPGQRADDFARAARLAVERGDPVAAWSLLARLDRRSDDEATRRRCRERAAGDPSLRARWAELDAEIEGLLAQLESLDGPSGGARRRAADPVRRDLRERLRSLRRTWPGCPAAATDGEEVADFRAVALPDEVLLLARGTGGSVALARRTALARPELLEILEGLGDALESGGASDPDGAAWRRRAAPLARALLPPGDADLPAVTVYALHGPLQGAPLAALPWLQDEGAGGGWLADRTTVALATVGTAATPIGPGASTGSGAAPLFVVDPREDLAGASGLVETYRRLFPDARMLVGPEAVRPALRDALPGAGFLHVDAHGRFVAALPELSGLELADGLLSLIELADLPVAGRFANLSGCQTGRWPVTADSGRYGLGGLLARLGVGWVIASRADLGDALARDFNAAFYRAVAEGAAPPVAYRRALDEVARRHPPASWGALLLLRGAGAPA